MTIAFSTAAADARLAVYLTATSQSAGVSVNGNATAGNLIIGTSSLSLPSTGILCTIALAQPPFTIASKVATLAGTPLTATPSAGGTAALAALADGTSTNGGPVVTGLSVGTSATDIIVTTTTFSTSIPVVVTSGTITSP